jgi:tRNA (guanine37-N1)-methyltransferase
MLAIALLHYPVVNKNGQTIGSAVTNLDIHDIARTARTFGVGAYFVVTPYADQQHLVAEITGHWQEGYGANYNPARKEALSLVRIADNLAAAIKTMADECAMPPLLVATSAKVEAAGDKSISYRQLRQKIAAGQPTLLLFGTAHGLAEKVIEMADAMLPPIYGTGDYNHLPVRSAASIILDRLLGTARD